MIFAMSPQPLNLRLLGGTSAPAAAKENTLWVNTGTAISSWDFSAEQPSRRSRNRNLFVHPYFSGASLTNNGVAFTCDSAGQVIASGTASEEAYYRILRPSDDFWLEPGTYTLSGCPAQLSSGTAYSLYVWDVLGDTGLAYDYGAGKSFTITKRTQISASIQVGSGKTASAALFKPQLEKASAATGFVKGDATGQLWIRTGGSASATVNALKSRGIWLSICGVKQYIGGNWVSREAKIMQSGAWKDIVNRLVLFDSSIEDGWTVKRMEGISLGTGTISGGKIVIDGQDLTAADMLFYKTQALDTSGYTNAKITVDAVTGTGASLVLQSTPEISKDGAAATAAAAVSISEADTYTLKLPAKADSYYVGIIIRGGTLTASEIWFE